MSPVSFAHGRIVIQVGSMLHAHVGSRDLGVVVTEVGFVLATNPDTVRAPDIAFVVCRPHSARECARLLRRPARSCR